MNQQEMFINMLRDDISEILSQKHYSDQMNVCEKILSSLFEFDSDFEEIYPYNLINEALRDFIYGDPECRQAVLKFFEQILNIYPFFVSKEYAESVDIVNKFLENQNSDVRRRDEESKKRLSNLDSTDNPFLAKFIKLNLEYQREDTVIAHWASQKTQYGWQFLCVNKKFALTFDSQYRAHGQEQGLVVDQEKGLIVFLGTRLPFSELLKLYHDIRENNASLFDSSLLSFDSIEKYR